MPRHDPLNNRGPAIGGKKPVVRAKKECKNCPDENVQLDPVLLSSKTEADRLWKHVTFGTMTCVAMCEGYAKLGLPGKPTGELRKIRDRLSQIISDLEARNETSPSQE